MPAINIGDIQIVAETQQTSSPSLKLMNSSGTVYYVSAGLGDCPNRLKLSDGIHTYTVGNWRLYYQAASVNSCDTIELPPGCYYAGGAGGRAVNFLWGANGGTGGGTVSYSCGGQTFYSYGGGGVNGKGTYGFSSVSVAGGDGGSGVSNESAGYVRIYIFG